MAGGIRERDDGGDEELSEINITPFIDVMLVLLIIFMVAAPLSTVDVPLELPVAAAKPEKRPEKPLFVSIKADRTLAVGEETVARSRLVHAIDAATSAKRDARIFVRADKTVPYGELMNVLNLLRGGGYTKVALVALESVGAGAETAGTVPAATPPAAPSGTPP